MQTVAGSPHNDDNQEDHNFDRGDSGASLTYPAQCSSLKKGGFVNIRGRPCRIVDVHSSKVGKHGHCKVTMTGLDLFTDKRYQAVHPSSHTVDVPVVKRTDYILVDLNQFLSLMDDKGHVRYDIPTPGGELGGTLRDKFQTKTDETIEVTVLSAMNEEIVINVKTGKA